MGDLTGFWPLRAGGTPTRRATESGIWALCSPTVDRMVAGSGRGDKTGPAGAHRSLSIQKFSPANLANGLGIRARRDGESQRPSPGTGSVGRFRAVIPLLGCRFLPLP